MSGIKVDPIGMHLGLALDGMTLGQAINLASRTVGEVAILKANDLVADQGSKNVVRNLNPLIVTGGGTWVDLKTFDTDGTMGNTMNKIGKNGARIASVHLLNSQAALKRALKDAGEYNCVLTGITVLTSYTEEEAEEIFHRPLEVLVPMLVDKARELGFKSIVCSATQLQDLIYSGLLKGITPIIPGTRSTTTANKEDLNFQAQTDSTENVFKILAENNMQGIVVLGSEVHKAPDPTAKLLEIKRSIADTLQKHGLELVPKIPLLG